MVSKSPFKVLIATICLLLFTLFSLSSSAPLYAETAAPLISVESGEIIPDTYIVVLSGERLQPAGTSKTRSSNKATAQIQQEIINTHQASIDSYGGRIAETYGTVLFGYSAYLPPQALAQVRLSLIHI